MEYSSGKIPVKVIRNDKIAKGIMSMWVEAKESLLFPYPGQFFEIYPKDTGHLLGRPISICDYDKEKNALRFVYQIKGYGTGEMSMLSVGDTVNIMGPLGKGFLGRGGESKDSIPVLVGGGMGIAPLLYLAKRLEGKCKVILGFREEPFLHTDYVLSDCEIVLAVEKSTPRVLGVKKVVKGTVIDALNDENVSGCRIFTCGPLPMLKAVAEYGKQHSSETFVSLEERMGCGIGVCLGCVTKEGKCICKDGPVFPASEVTL